MATLTRCVYFLLSRMDATSLTYENFLFAGTSKCFMKKIVLVLLGMRSSMPCANPPISFAIALIHVRFPGPLTRFQYTSTFTVPGSMTALHV